MIKKLMTFIRMHYYCKALYNHIFLLTIFRPNLKSNIYIIANLLMLIDKINGTHTYYAKHQWGKLNENNAREN